MKKQIIKDIGEEKEIETDYSYGDKPFEIDKLIAFLNSSKKEGATHITLHGRSYDGQCDSIDVQPVSVREESDKEYECRQKEEAYKKAYNDKLTRIKEKEQYEALKLKYGN